MIIAQIVLMVLAAEGIMSAWAALKNPEFVSHLIKRAPIRYNFFWMFAWKALFYILLAFFLKMSF